MHPGYPQPATFSTPSSPHIQAQNAIIDSSETESETEPESVLESHPDNEYDFAIENQLGIDRLQCGNIESNTPVDVPVDISYNVLNDDGKFF